MNTTTNTPTKAERRAIARSNFAAKAKAAWRSFTAWVGAMLTFGAGFVDVLKEELPALAPYLDAKLVSAIGLLIIFLRVRKVRAEQ